MTDPHWPTEAEWEAKRVEIGALFLPAYSFAVNLLYRLIDWLLGRFDA